MPKDLYRVATGGAEGLPYHPTEVLQRSVFQEVGTALPAAPEESGRTSSLASSHDHELEPKAYESSSAVAEIAQWSFSAHGTDCAGPPTH